MRMSLSSVKDLFKYFVGSWKIQRKIGTMGVANGQANFTLKSPHELSFREDLEVRYSHSDRTEAAYQEYTYRLSPDEQKITKVFKDERLFYELVPDFKEQKAFGAHLCEADNYKAAYTFVSDDDFILEYDVRGPQKDYRIETNFTRVTES